VADRTVSVKLKADIASYQRNMAAAAASTQAFGKSAGKSGSEIDKLSGRLRVIADLAVIGTPALTGFGAAGVGAMVSLAAEAGAAAGALGVTLLAVHGLGDGLKALNAYQLDPTAANLKKLRAALDELGPSGAHFVEFLDSLQPQIQSLQMAARDGLFPGAEEGIDALLTKLPEVRGLVSRVADELGKQSASAGKSLAGNDFEAFLKYLQTDGVPILHDTAHTIGNLAVAGANLMAAFGPLSMDFSGGLLGFSKGLADASKNLESSPGFQEFIDYIETQGPHALATLESLANAILQIVEATAPLAGPVLTALGGMADAIARIADSDLGTPIFAGLAALALMNRAMVVTQKLTASTFGGPAVAGIRSYAAGLSTVATRSQMTATEIDAMNKKVAATNATTAKAAGFLKGHAAQIGLLSLALSGVADSAGLTNTALLGMAGPWGAAAGLALDFWHATDGLNDAMAQLDLAEASGDAGQLAAALKNANSQLEAARANTILGTSAFGDFAGGIVNTIAPASNMTKFMGMLTGKTGDLASDAEDAQKALDNLRNGVSTLVDPTRAVVAALQEETDALQNATDAMREHRQEALRGLNAQLDYQQAIDDATKALKDNGKTVDKSTEKGRNNLRALYDLAATWNSQSDAIKNTRGNLQAAQAKFESMATAMGVSADKAHDLAKRLFEIKPKDVHVTTPGLDDAISKAKTLKQVMDGLHSKDIYLSLHYQTIGNRGPTGGGPLPGGQPKADGGTVGGTRHPYGDKVLSMLAPGEEVISNRHGQADRFRADRAAGRIPGYANGGTAGSTYTSMIHGGSGGAPAGPGLDERCLLRSQGAEGVQGRARRGEEVARQGEAVPRRPPVPVRLHQVHGRLGLLVPRPLRRLQASSGSPWAAGAGWGTRSRRSTPPWLATPPTLRPRRPPSRSPRATDWTDRCTPRWPRPGTCRCCRRSPTCPRRRSTSGSRRSRPSRTRSPRSAGWRPTRRSAPSSATPTRNSGTSATRSTP
jgi:tetratricopeptide (TPR) repeat protein